MTYSTAEMVAAILQDHAMARVVGVDSRTGGGGGSPWHLDIFYRLTKEPLLSRAPDAPALQMAVRRCFRTGKNADVLLENTGVVPDILHSPSRRDLLEGDVDLITRVMNLFDK